MENQDKNNERARISNNQRFILFILIVILIIGTCLRLYKLGSKDLWLDELIMRSYAGYPYRFLWDNPFLDGNLSYPSMLQKLFLKLSSENEFNMRLPTALFSIASIFTLYLMGKVLYGIKEGMVASFLLTFSLFHIYMTQDYKLAYMVTTTFYPLSIYSLFKGMETGRNHYWFIFIISVWSLLYMHFMTIPAIFSIFAWTFLLLILFFMKPATYWKDVLNYHLFYKFFMKLAISVIIIVGGSLPISFVFIKLLGSSYGYKGESTQAFRTTISSDFILNLFTSYSGTNLLFIIFAIMSICWLITSFRTQRDMLTGSLLFSCIFLPFMAYWLTNVGPPLFTRYFSYMLPIFLLIVARGIVSSVSFVLDRFHIQYPVKPYVTTLLIAGISLFTFNPLWSYYHNDRTYYRDAATYMLSTIKDKDIIFYKASFDIEGLLYYMDKFGRDDIFIYPKSILFSRNRPPMFFRSLDKIGLLTPGLKKKNVSLFYTGKQDINFLINKLPAGFRFYYISDKEEPQIQNITTEKKEFSAHNTITFKYFGQYTENFFIYFGQR